MKRSIFGVAALAIGGSLALTAMAHAGAQWWWPIYVDRTGRSASGALATVRSMPDSNSLIGCALFATSADCVASDASGMWVSCVTSDPAHVATLRALNGDSMLAFTWDANGVCTSFQLENVSAYAPKAP